MAPAAVQTKHSVAVKITSAPTASIQAAMAGPGTPSRSPSTIAFLPSNIQNSPLLVINQEFLVSKDYELILMMALMNFGF
jgi:hypothetical protein